MNMTLRTRLALLVAVSVALSVGPVLYLTWKMVGETMIRMEEKSFSSLMLVEEESLNAAFMNQLANKVRAVQERKSQLEETAAKDKTLLANAQQRAKSLLEEYIKNIGEAVGEEYKIDWIYVDASGNPLGTAADASAETASAETGAEMPAA